MSNLSVRVGGRAEWQFDLFDLRLFVNVVEAASLTRGAERSCLSAAAASLRIKNLEEGLGAQLLTRNKRGVAATEAGRVFAEHARQVLQQVERLRSEMQPFSHGLRGHVRLFANTLAIAELLPGVLSEFLAANPTITVDLQERLSAEIVRAVHEGVADIGVISSDARAEGLEMIPYRRDRLVLACPARHPLAESSFVRFADALDYDFVGLETASAIHGVLQQEAARHGREMRLRIQVHSFDAMCRMIESEIGIGVLPELAARRHSASTRVHLVQLLDPWAERELRICVRQMAQLPVYARALIEAMAPKT